MGDNIRDLISLEIRKEKNNHIKRLSKIIRDNIKFDKEKIYYYSCQGSGYYLKFNGVSGETVIFDIYSKGGIKKDKKFYINWYGINCIKEVE